MCTRWLTYTPCRLCRPRNGVCLIRSYYSRLQHRISLRVLTCRRGGGKGFGCCARWQCVGDGKSTKCPLPPTHPVARSSLAYCNVHTHIHTHKCTHIHIGWLFTLYKFTSINCSIYRMMFNQCKRLISWRLFWIAKSYKIIFSSFMFLHEFPYFPYFLWFTLLTRYVSVVKSVLRDEFNFHCL